MIKRASDYARNAWNSLRPIEKQRIGRGVAIGGVIGGAIGLYKGAFGDQGIISAPLGYGALGATVGIGAAIALPAALRNWRENSIIYNMFSVDPSMWTTPAGQAEMNNILNSPNISDFNKNRLRKLSLRTNQYNDLALSRAPKKPLEDLAYKMAGQIYNAGGYKDDAERIINEYIKGLQGDERTKAFQSGRITKIRDALRAASPFHVKVEDNRLVLKYGPNMDNAYVKQALDVLGQHKIRLASGDLPRSIGYALFNTLNELAPGAWPMENLPRGAHFGYTSVENINAMVTEHFGTWDKVEEFFKQLPEGIDPEEFSRKFASKFASYSHAGITGLIGPESILDPVTGQGVEWQPKLGMRSLSSNLDVSRTLQMSGRGDLASAIKTLQDQGYAVRAFTYQDKKLAEESGNAIVELAIGAQGASEDSRGRGWMHIPVLDQGGVHKGPAGKDYYVGRQIVDPWQLAERLQAGGPLGDEKLRTLLPDLFAAEMVIKLGGTKSAREKAELLEMLQQEVSSAMLWETSEFRPNRVGNIQNPVREIIRQNQIKVFIPTDEEMAVQMGYEIGGPNAPFDVAMRRINEPVVNYLWSATELGDKYYTAGSETAARKGVFDRAGLMMDLDWGAIENPVNKPAIIQRDLAKPFRITSWGPGAEDTLDLRRLMYTDLASTVLESNKPLVARYFPVLSSEQVFLQELATRIKSGAFSPLASANYRAAIENVLQGLDEAKQIFLLRGIEPLVHLAEGQTALWAPGAAMSHTKKIRVDMLSEDIIGLMLSRLKSKHSQYLTNGKLDLGRLVSDWKAAAASTADEISLPKGLGLGISRDSREVKVGAYSETDFGKSILTDIETTEEGFVVHLEEKYPLARAKIGTGLQKGMSYEIGELDTLHIAAGVLNKMRTDKSTNFLYANEPIRPALIEDVKTLGGGRRRNVGFVRAKDIKFSDITPQFMREILTEYMPKMTQVGRKRFAEEIKALGGQLIIDKKTGKHSLRLPSGKEMLTFHERAKELVLKTLFSKEGQKAFFYRTDPFASLGAAGAQEINEIRDLMSSGNINRALEKGIALLSLRGLTTEVMGWDTPESNIPRRVGTTLPELQFYKQLGMEEVYTEMLERRRILGDKEVSKRFYNAEGRILTEATADLSDIVPRTYTVENLKELSRYDPYLGKGIPPDEAVPIRSARMNDVLKYDDNWVLDLRIADEQLHKADTAVKQAKLAAALGGDTRILIPGTKSDLWQSSTFLTEMHGDVEGTPFVKPLQRLVRATSDYYRGMGTIEDILEAKKDYLSAVYTVKTDLFTGRGSATPDVGPNTTGRVVYRNYRSQFAGQLGDLSEHVMGVTAEDYSRMIEEGGRRININGQEFLVGEEIRYPVTGPHGRLVFKDETLENTVASKNVIAVDETHRYLSQMDFDGDTLYVKIMTKEGSVKEILNHLQNQESLYSSLLKNAKYWGGLEEEETTKIAMLGGPTDSAHSLFLKRAEKIRSVSGEAGAHLANTQIADRMAKMHTSYIGEYSNISKRGIGMLGAVNFSQYEKTYTPADIAQRLSSGISAPALQRAGVSQANLASTLQNISITEGDRLTGRIYFLNELQQIAINFGRQKTVGGGTLDPGALAKDIGRMLEDVMAGNVDIANRQMFRIMESLGFIKSQQERFGDYLQILGTTSAESQELIKRQVIFEEMAQGFFQHIDPKKARDLFAQVRAAQRKGEHLTGTLQEVQEDYDSLSRALIEAGEQGNMPVPGVTGVSLPPQSSGAAREHLADINRRIKAAGEFAKGPISNMVEAFKTPAGKTALGIMGAGLLAAGAIGLMTPPIDLDVPNLPSELDRKTMASMQRTPDTALVGADGEAPIPGGRFGNVMGHGGGPMALPQRPSPTIKGSNKFYYQQTNKVPNVTMYHTGDRPLDKIAAASSLTQASRPGMGTNINVSTSPTARRLSKVEIEERAREEMTY